MASEVGPILDLAFKVKAGTDLSADAKQYTIVKLSAADECDATSNAADVPLGVLQNKPKAGQAAIVRLLGVSKVRVNAAGLAINTNWGTDAAGRAIAKVADKVYFGGRCIEAAGATADLLATVMVQTLSPNTLSV